MYIVVSLTNCEYVFCKKTEVHQTIEQVMKLCDAATPCFIYGGGKSLQGIYAYYNAVRELSHQVSDIDELFVACGTGTTLTGICAGMQKLLYIQRNGTMRHLFVMCLRKLLMLILRSTSHSKGIHIIRFDSHCQGLSFL